MPEEGLGKKYQDGEIIIHQGELGDCMYVVQDGRVEVFLEEDDQVIPLALLGEGELFGEMAIFENEVRSASVRADGSARLLTVDKKNFLSRVHQDPTLAFRLMQKLSHRIREMNSELTRLKAIDNS